MPIFLQPMTASALNGQLPQYIGSTGGLLNSAETEEKYAITWTSSAAQAFELPTGGAAMMNEGENIMYFARKEQCLALGTQLRTKFKPRIEDYKIYRIFPGGDTEFLHPSRWRLPREGERRSRHGGPQPPSHRPEHQSRQHQVQRSQHLRRLIPSSSVGTLVRAARMRACSALTAPRFLRPQPLAPI